MRLGMSGANLMLPAASTLLDTVTMAARAAILPAGVSTVTSRLLQDMRLAGVDSDSGTCSPSFATSVPSPWRQAIAALRSCARALSIAETSFRSLPAKLAPSTNSAASRPVAEILRQAPTRRTTSALRARRRRWRGWRAPARREIPRSRRRARCGGRCGFSGPTAPARRRAPRARASLIIGLVSGLCIQRAPRSNGTSKVALSVRQRPPIWLAASTTITLRLAAMTRRAAAMPAAPAPITTMSASRGNGAAPARRAEQPAAPQAPRTPTGNRGGSLSCHGFRKP